MTAARKHINLYQTEFRPVRVPLPTRSLASGVALFALGLVLLHAWDRWQLNAYRQQAERITRQADQIEQQLRVAVQPPQAADPQVITEAQTLEARIRALQIAQGAVGEGTLGSETGYSARFLALSRAAVPGAWLTRVELNDGGRTMNLEGRALKGDAPAQLIAALGRQPLFAGLSYAGLDVHPPTAPDQGAKPAAAPGYLEFTLSARLTPPNDAPRETPSP